MNGSQPTTWSKRSFDHSKNHNRKKLKNKKPNRKEGSNEEILLEDVRDFLSVHGPRPPQEGSKKDTSRPTYQPPARFTEVEVQISKLSSTGDGLGLSPDKNHVYVVPFTAPGDLVKVKLVNHKGAENYTLADFIEVLKPSTQRDDSRIKCPYFTRCGGCHFQMLSYDDQLAHKKTIIERAYKNFSELSPEFVPLVGETVGSPLQYGYRTKLTPHFDKPPGPRRRKEGQPAPRFDGVPPIGFNYKNRSTVLDVEDCPISTDAVRAGLKKERANVAERLEKYTKGATILLRESTTRTPRAKDRQQGLDDSTEKGDEVLYDVMKMYITDNNATSTEYVDSYVFQNPAGAFFQNNNSILPRFTQYIRDHILPTNSSNGSSASTPTTTLLDAYCGSGLFTITLAPLFQRSIGIDVSGPSIEFARINAKLNHMDNATFHAATAAAIFASLPKDVEPDETAVVIDPPRKGCDEDFLRQLLEFGPRRVCYVSCNVHTQARDVGFLVEGTVAGKPPGEGENLAAKRTRYRIESITGFDFFPQSSHVEGVAILERVDT